MKRYDSIEWNTYGSFHWSPDTIKECSDGELVKYDDAQTIIAGLQKRLNDLDKRYEWLESNSTLKDFPEPYTD